MEAEKTRSTTLLLSGDADGTPPGRRPTMPLRRIIGARPARTRPELRRAFRLAGWLGAAGTVLAGGVLLWVLLFGTIAGGDVWLGRKLPTAGDGGAPAPTATSGPTRPAPATSADRRGGRSAGADDSKPAPASASAGTGSSGSGSTSTTGSGNSGSGSGSGNPGSGSDDSGSGNSGSGNSGSGGHGSDD